MEISLTGIKTTLSTFFHRYHVVLFVVVAVGGLAAVIFMLNLTIIAASQTPADGAPVTSTSFDQATIDRVNQLDTTQNSTPLSLPGGQRINPFVE